MALVAHFNSELHHMDVKIDFLNRKLVEVYMSQLESFEVLGKEDMACN